MSSTPIITNDTADTIIAENTLSGDRVGWNALDSTDKTVQLRRAEAVINAGSWKGCKHDSAQSFAFPRIDDDRVLIGEANEADPDSPLAPVAVREAIALLAWSLTDRIEEWERRRAVSGGVAAHGVGGMSESFTPRPGNLTRADLESVPEVWSRLSGLWRVGGRII